MGIEHSMPAIPVWHGITCKTETYKILIVMLYWFQLNHLSPKSIGVPIEFKLNIPQLAIDNLAQIGKCWTGMAGLLGSIQTRSQSNFYYP